MSHFRNCVCACVCLIPGPKQWDEGPGGVKGAALTSFIFQLFILSVVSCSFVNSKNRAQKPQPPHRIGMRVSGFWKLRVPDNLTVASVPPPPPRRTLSSASFCILAYPLAKIFTFPRAPDRAKSESFCPVKLMRFCVLISDGSIDFVKG